MTGTVSFSLPGNSAFLIGSCRWLPPPPPPPPRPGSAIHTIWLGARSINIAFSVTSGTSLTMRRITRRKATWPPTDASAAPPTRFVCCSKRKCTSPGPATWTDRCPGGSVPGCCSTDGRDDGCGACRSLSRASARSHCKSDARRSSRPRPRNPDSSRRAYVKLRVRDVPTAGRLRVRALVADISVSIRACQAGWRSATRMDLQPAPAVRHPCRNAAAHCGAVRRRRPAWLAGHARPSARTTRPRARHAAAAVGRADHDQHTNVAATKASMTSPSVARF